MDVNPAAEYPVLYLNSGLRTGGIISAPRLRGFTERHKIQLPAPFAQEIGEPLFAVVSPTVQGVVFAMNSGLPTLDQVRLAEYAVSHGRRVWFYWPGELAVECIDRERLSSYLRHVCAANLWYEIRPAAQLAYSVFKRLSRLKILNIAAKLERQCHAELHPLLTEARPAPLQALRPPSSAARLKGVGVYLRTDYWALLTSGGSYGHTCYVAQSLARTIDRLVCFTPSHYTLLDDLGLEQSVIPPPGVNSSETDLLQANAHYYPILRAAFERLRPAFIYERLCLGNYCGARLSQDLGVPYIVEYNGSEIEMSRTFSGHRMQHEELFIKAEEAAFRQATAISVISEPVKDDLVARGIPASKILVNPNGVDPCSYAPAEAAERATIRSELGFTESDRIVGFIGTFGGWHGIDLLAEAMPQICRRSENVRFLLIGDGNYKHLVTSSVAEHGLQSRVTSLGRVPQKEGARFLRACDIYVSPHNRVMTGGKFFGSPTKLFEYMAMSGGIVASDLDQIGEVLTPSLRASELNGSQVSVSNERAVLCQPGNLAEFVNGVSYLVNHPELSATLGRNAREAALAHFTWDRHIDRLWDFVFRTASCEPKPDSRRRMSEPTIPLREEAKPDIDGRTPNPELVRVADYSGKRVLAIEPDRSIISVFENAGAETIPLAAVTDVLPFSSESFDLVYMDRAPGGGLDARVLSEIHRVLRPGGSVVAAFEAENSFHYWVNHFFWGGLTGDLLAQFSMAELVSRKASKQSSAKPYTIERLRILFTSFDDVSIQRNRFGGETLFVKASKSTRLRQPY